MTVDFYKLPFKSARKYLRRIYLSLDFITDLGLDPRSLNLKAVYPPTSMAPILLVNSKIKINDYIFLGTTEDSKLETVFSEPFMLIGYKHFDKWKFEDGSQIGDLNLKTENKLQRMIQRRVLGPWTYWSLRLLRKI